MDGFQTYYSHLLTLIITVIIRIYHINRHCQEVVSRRWLVAIAIEASTTGLNRMTTIRLNSMPGEILRIMS